MCHRTLAPLSTGACLQNARNCRKYASIIVIPWFILVLYYGYPGWTSSASASDNTVRLRSGTRRFTEHDLQWVSSCGPGQRKEICGYKICEPKATSYQVREQHVVYFGESALLT